MSVQSLETYVSERTHERPQGIMHAGVKHAARCQNWRQNPKRPKFAARLPRNAHNLCANQPQKTNDPHSRCSRCGPTVQTDWASGCVERDAERVPKPRKRSERRLFCLYVARDQTKQLSG